MVDPKTAQGRHRLSSCYPVVLGTTATLAIPPHDRRVTLVLPCHPTIRYTLGSDANVVLDQGFNIPINNVPTVLTIEDCGQVIQRGFYVIASGAATILVIDTIQEET